MDDDLDKALVDLESTQRALTALAKDAWLAYKGAFYAMDELAVASINRTVSLNAAFCSLMRADNFLAAAHLVRLQLDTALRFSAAWLVESPDEFVNRVFAGENIRKIKDKNGELMRDAYLVDQLSKQWPWIYKVYQETSGYIHLSCKHIYNVFCPSNLDNNEIRMVVSPSSPHIPCSIKLEATYAMLHITEIIQNYVSGWIMTKLHPETVRSNTTSGNSPDKKC